MCIRDRIGTISENMISSFDITGSDISQITLDEKKWGIPYTIGLNDDRIVVTTGRGYILFYDYHLHLIATVLHYDFSVLNEARFINDKVWIYFDDGAIRIYDRNGNFENELLPLSLIHI